MRLVRWAGAAVVAGACLVGCSQEQPANETLPSASAAVETSAAPEPLGPPDLPMPAEAREETAAGAEAFLRYYMDVYTKAQATMDPTYIEQFSQGCELCDALIRRLNENKSAGYTYDGGAIALTGASFSPEEDGHIDSAFAIEQTTLTIRDSNGAIASEDAGASYNCGAILTWSSSNHSWILSQWDVN